MVAARQRKNRVATIQRGRSAFTIVGKLNVLAHGIVNRFRACQRILLHKPQQRRVGLEPLGISCHPSTGPCTRLNLVNLLGCDSMASGKRLWLVKSNTRTASAMGRSKLGLSFCTLADARLIVVRPSEICSRNCQGAGDTILGFLDRRSRQPDHHDDGVAIARVGFHLDRISVNAINGGLNSMRCSLTLTCPPDAQPETGAGADPMNRP